MQKNPGETLSQTTEEAGIYIYYLNVYMNIYILALNLSLLQNERENEER